MAVARRITTEERQLIIKTATKRPRSLGQPFTRWSVRKLAYYLATKKGKKHLLVHGLASVLRQILAEAKITFQRTKTWKESPDPLHDEKLSPYRVPARTRARTHLCLRRVRTARRQARGRVVLG